MDIVFSGSGWTGIGGPIRGNSFAPHTHDQHDSNARNQLVTHSGQPKFDRLHVSGLLFRLLLPAVTLPLLLRGACLNVLLDPAPYISMILAVNVPNYPSWTPPRAPSVMYSPASHKYFENNPGIHRFVGGEHIRFKTAFCRPRGQFARLPTTYSYFEKGCQLLSRCLLR